MVRRGDRAQRKSTQIEGYQMAGTCSCTHTAVFFRCSRTHTECPFLLLMHRFLFSGYLVLIYSPSLPLLKELAAGLLPPLPLSHTHFLLFLFLHTLPLYVLSLSTSLLPLISVLTPPCSLFSLSHFFTCLLPFFLLSFPHLFHKSDFTLHLHFHKPLLLPWLISSNLTTLFSDSRSDQPPHALSMIWSFIPSPPGLIVKIFEQK